MKLEIYLNKKGLFNEEQPFIKTNYHIIRSIPDAQNQYR